MRKTEIKKADREIRGAERNTLRECPTKWKRY